LSTERGGRRRPLPAVIAMVLLLLASACSSAKPKASPSTTAAPETTTTPPTSSTSSTTSTTVRSSSTSTTRTSVAATTLGPGDASISGTVQGPAGPVDGATVHIERLVGSAVAATDVTTAGGGAWRLDSVLGGAYRIRAFKAPDLGQSEVEVFFLAATDKKTVDLRLAGTGGQQLLAIVNPNPPRVNQPATVTVQIGSPRVDDQGRPAIAPQVGTVLLLSVGAGMALESSPQMTTDGTGAASWRVRCLAEGPSSVSLTLPTGATPVNLPPCTAAGAAPAATTTTRAR
jgi:hypothetical protein